MTNTNASGVLLFTSNRNLQHMTLEILDVSEKKLESLKMDLLVDIACIKSKALDRS